MSSLKIPYPPHTYSRLFRPWDTTQLTTPSAAVQEHDQAPAHPQDERVVVIGEEANNSSEPENLSVSGKSTPIPTATPEANIKVEFLKVEDVTTDVDQSDSDDEELEVADDDDMHTSRTSECASSQSNFSQLSEDNESLEHEQRTAEGNAFMSESSQFPNIATRPPTDHVYGMQLPRRHTMPSLHFPDTRQKFDVHHQNPLHLLPHSVMPTIVPTPATIWSAAPTFSASNHLTSALSSTNIPTSTSAAVAIAAAATAPGYAGMDPYGLGLVEQEYVRIMAEEAHLKAINARKQRPKKFKCPHCDVAFSNNGQLKGHIRIHTGERPFKCDVESCGKTFTRNEELTRHKRIHTGLRPYPCSACGKKFGRRDHLKKHMKTHMPQERQMGSAIFVPMFPYLYGY
uniref:Krueppel-like factor 15 n=1 Tax=Bactrocera latifrons TaxID=174628 RepID=A0A0K8W8S8_BACLA